MSVNIAFLIVMFNAAYLSSVLSMARLIRKKERKENVVTNAASLNNGDSVNGNPIRSLWGNVGTHRTQDSRLHNAKEEPRKETKSNERKWGAEMKFFGAGILVILAILLFAYSSSDSLSNSSNLLMNSTSVKVYAMVPMAMAMVVLVKSGTSK